MHRDTGRGQRMRPGPYNVMQEIENARIGQGPQLPVFGAPFDALP
ncbi:hypothetical protein [Streptomyces sp. NPDC048638]